MTNENLDPVVLMECAKEAYGDFFATPSKLGQKLKEAQEIPDNDYQIALLKAAISIATSTGSFARNLPVSDENTWESRQ
ncbi:MAG: hypothetical protein E6R05_02550 [Candidatus Moraniibacteriota bacterium]|nr:MAG: hypothetical protein E6R05_02550 [Candidatus Moranbacteria bacterium]